MEASAARPQGRRGALRGDSPPLYSLMASPRASMDSMSKLLVGSSCGGGVPGLSGRTPTCTAPTPAVQLTHQDEDIGLPTGQLRKHDAGFLPTYSGQERRPSHVCHLPFLQVTQVCAEAPSLGSPSLWSSYSLG